MPRIRCVRWSGGFLVALLTCFLLVGTGRAAEPPALGAHYRSDGAVDFRVYSSGAERIELHLFAQHWDADEKLTRLLSKDPDTAIWSTTVTPEELSAAGITTVYYGYRCWGPNWPYDASWTKGSQLGFRSDVDDQGNRFNPNKLLIDPYTRELSHDPTNLRQQDTEIYVSGPNHRGKDSGRWAPKGIVLREEPLDVAPIPTGRFKDDIIYEVHVRGFTGNDESLPAEVRGTYAGAGQKAAYLKELGVTAVEFLPIQEVANDQNDIDPNSDNGDNYWGYDPLAYFAPDRRFASDKQPGGPTREFRQMVQKLHAAGIKVYLDVVFNHTGEGGLYVAEDPAIAKLLSFRGLDNPTYYELAADPRYYYSQSGQGSGGSSGVGPNLNVARPVTRNLILDALRYWKNEMGVDGFRFDLAPILANRIERNGFQFDPFDPHNVLNRAVRELPARKPQGGAGADLIAEPWGGSYEIGRFPPPWAHWNDRFRDTIRRSQNRLGIADVTPAELATRLAGSSDLLAPGHQDRQPAFLVNFIVAHDGMTLRDLYSYNEKQNGRLDWPKGPSDGGRSSNEELLWDQGGDPALQRQATRTGMALLMLAAGVPMMTGGDELYRTQYGNNNPYNVDSSANYLPWAQRNEYQAFFLFTQRLLHFRQAHPALRPDHFFTGQDQNGNGLKDITWYRDDGHEADAAYLDAIDHHFLAFRLDGTEANDSAPSLLVAYNGWKDPLTITLPSPTANHQWHLAADTADRMEKQANFHEPTREEPLSGERYEIQGRSLLLLIEK